MTLLVVAVVWVAAAVAVTRWMHTIAVCDVCRGDGRTAWTVHDGVLVEVPLSAVTPLPPGLLDRAGRCTQCRLRAEAVSSGHERLTGKGASVIAGPAVSAGRRPT